jgi:hypothetical protein
LPQCIAERLRRIIATDEAPIHTDKTGSEFPDEFFSSVCILASSVAKILSSPRSLQLCGELFLILDNDYERIDRIEI